MMNNVHSLPMILPTEFIPLIKITRHHFFLLCFNFFFHCNSLGISVYIYQFSGSVLQGIALVNHATSFDVVLHPFAIEFRPTQQDLLVVCDVHS
jgi:hypothetical protein